MGLIGPMGDKRPTDPWRGLALRAERRHGVLSRAELHDCGLSDKAIWHAVDVGRLHRIFPGAYGIGYRHTERRSRLVAATLACGPGAAISHRSAAALLGLLDRGPTVIDVIASGDRGRKIDGIHVHLVGQLRPEEAGTVDGIPCTSPARTLVDLAGTIGARTLRSCFERAAARRMLDLDAVERSMRPGRTGVRELRRLVGEWRQAAPLARRERLKSPLEAKVLPLLIQDGVPAPRPNAPVRLVGGKTIEVDFLWPDQRFVVEADSRDFHATNVAFERDRWRDRELMRADYASLRVTRLAAEREAAEIVQAIHRQLRRGRQRR